MPNSRSPVIFLAFANDRVDRTRYLRELANEQRGIRNALGAAERNGDIELVERSNATLSDIIDVFQHPRYKGRIAVFHYGGHADSYRLLLETDGGGVQIAHSEGLARFLSNQNTLKLVFLNGCSTQDQADDLRNAGIPNVIATSRVIDDKIARRFAIRFYKGLGSYSQAQNAFEDAESEIITLTGSQNFRMLYWDKAAETPPQEFPWHFYSDEQGAWRLNPQHSKGVVVDPQTPKAKIGEYAHVLCNRYKQVDEFESRYLTIPEDRRQPQVYIIHGHRRQQHESLIARFIYEHIGKKTYVKPLEVKWPFKGQVQNLLKIRLLEQLEGSESLQKKAEQIKATDILRYTSLSGRQSIIVQHNIPGEYWNKTTGDLIKWYIGNFWNVLNSEFDTPQFYIFLNVFYSEELEGGSWFNRLLSSKYYKDSIIKELENIATSCEDNCSLLTELHGVKKHHVEDWLITTNLNEIDEFSDLANKIFRRNPQNKTSMFMAEVERDLKKALTSFRNRHARTYI